MSPVPTPETREVMRQLQQRRARRHRLQVIVAVLAAVIVAGGLLTALAYAWRRAPSTAATTNSPTTLTQAGSTTSATVISSTTTTRRPAPTTSVIRPSTTEPSATTPTSGRVTTTVSAGSAVGRLVVIDPGHQGQGNSDPEPVGPGSSTTKPKVSDGTAGAVTGTPESELVLAVSFMLRDALEARGVRVIMTRTSQDVDLSNIERTEIANEAHADLYIRVHADGAESGSVHGIHVLYPALIEGWTDDIALPSKRAAQLAQQALVDATGATDRGIDPRDDMTGFNWSDVPVIIPEIGFMSNAEEDRLLATASYRQKIADALAKAAIEFLSGGN
jgi:N-acetylmuramoyl-L-alanine amidase